MTRRGRIGLGILGALALLVVALGAGTLALVFTSTGTQWALSELRARLQDAGIVLEWESVEGTLGSGLRVDDFSLLSVRPGRRIDLAIARLEFAWQPWNLLGYALVFDSVRIDDLRYASDAAETNDGPLSITELQNDLFGLPLSIELQSLEARAVQLRFNDAAFAFDALTGAAALDSDELELNGVQFQRGLLDIAASATMQRSMSLAGALDWRLQAGGRDFAGHLDLGGSLGQLELRHALSAPLELTSGGTLDPGLFTARPRLDLRHTAGAIDLAAFGIPAVVLRDLDVRTSGSTDTLAIRGGLGAEVDGFEPLDLALGLEYSPGTLGIERLRLMSPQVDLEASGALELAPLALALQWNLARLDSGASLPRVELSGLSGAGSVQLGDVAGTQELRFSVASLEGLLNGYPLTLSGDAALIDSQLASLDLQASNEDNVLSVTGSAAPALDLQWRLEAPQLAQLWQGLGGSLQGQGAISGTPEAPVVSGSLAGNGLQYETGASTLSLASLQLDAAYGDAANRLELDLGALALQAGGVTRTLLDDGRFVLGGAPAAHTLDAELHTPEGDIQLALNGALDGGDWRGGLQRASLDSDYGSWMLEAPAAIAYTAGAATLESTCLAYADVRLCLEGAKPAGAGIDANVTLRNLPLAWLNPAPDAGGDKPAGLQGLQDARALNLPQNLRVAGFADADFELAGLAGGTWNELALQVRPRDLIVTVTPPALAEEGAEAVSSERFRFDVNQLRLASAAGTWTGEATLGVAHEGTAGFQEQGDLRARLGLAADGALDGTLAFAFSDLAWLESFVPTLQSLRGALDGNATIGGTREAPIVDAALDLRDGGFALPEYGLDVADIDGSLRSVGSEDFTLNLSARSGEGSVTLAARAQDLLRDDRSVNASLSGEDFRAVATEYASADISPALEAQFADGELRVNGRVDVPRMALDIAELVGDVGNSGVSVSRDAVVVSTADTATATVAGERVVVPLYANLVVALGNDVTLRGFGLDASLAGELTLEQAPNRPLLVYGELNIPEGSYEIYNQRLNTEDGRVMFFGNPTNPVVDIRAFRETPTAEVGMQLSGSINDIQGQLYSTPTLPESEILALLVTGKSFNNVGSQDSDALLGAIASFGFERGQGLTNAVGSKLGIDSVTVVEGNTLRESALGLGKYITPNLLMQYKVGLFDRQSVLSIDYSLSERLKLEVETGISQSIEISYTIEKD